MKNGIMIFLIGFIVAFVGGYFIYQGDSTASVDVEQTDPDVTDEKTIEEDVATDTEPTTVSAEARVISDQGCLACHAVSSLDLDGASTGPDLSDAYNITPGKHGKELDEFLQEPTSAVMTTVIDGNPLSDEDRVAIVEALRKAADQ
ncbi:cytochrome C [Desertibacillus haloalkaliphilus]|uniref:cytochrome C n=1 Tax=Desertibacillus haloalkaliphilus TaxID=1328930 RepID=UPI001C25F26B|nr:cytochrome C [Desertibacillus haloalkaliphilus]MBU8908336.1 cytochrome C [Desertibacillus haloalkaliphilus]